MSDTRASFENAIAADPDNLAALSAFADFLMESGDPRGDYMRLQLALEDRNQPASRLRAMEQDTYEIRMANEREWLGPFYEHVYPVRRNQSVVEPVEPNITIHYHRGWLHTVRFEQANDAAIAALAECPIAHMISAFIVEEDPVAEVDFTPLEALRNLWSLEIGHPRNFAEQSLLNRESCQSLAKLDRLRDVSIHVGRMSIRQFWRAKWPELESLEFSMARQTIHIEMLLAQKNFKKLKHLSIIRPNDGERTEVGDDWEVLFLHRSMPALKYLIIQTPTFGDDSVRKLVNSPMMGTLQGLDLCRSGITDEGAEILAQHPAVPKLKYLNLDENNISPIGIDAFARVGVTISQRQNLGPMRDDEDWDDFELTLDNT
ncbi:MAG: TIGR02996 domain-containing protein [Fimbriiglobus sp.]